MTSSKPLIALRLPVDMHSKIVELAAREHRSPANFIEHTLGRLLDVHLKPVFTDRELKQIERHEARQVTLDEAIARAVERGPVGKPAGGAVGQVGRGKVKSKRK